MREDERQRESASGRAREGRQRDGRRERSRAHLLLRAEHLLKSLSPHQGVGVSRLRAVRCIFMLIASGLKFELLGDEGREGSQQKTGGGKAGRRR